MKNKGVTNTAIYQAESGAIAFRGDFERETIWGSLNQIAELFGRDKSVISRHINNVFNSKELEPEAVVAKIATTASDGKTYQVDYYNLDMILSVGYRVNSKQATQFRIWATKTLKQHLLDGYTINRKRISRNYDKFTRAVADVKALLPAGNKIKPKDVLELINAFAGTWFSLDAYDRNSLPQKGASKKQAAFTAEELSAALHELKKDLIGKKEATDIFGQERRKDGVAGIVGSIFQSVFGEDAYPSAEEKAAHLLYFMVKNHPFTDGNKRSGAFAFVWFLRKSGLLRASMTPEALTALTLLLAESDPKEKDKMIGLVLLLISGKIERTDLGKSGRD